jgi:hypothetical protein
VQAGWVSAGPHKAHYQNVAIVRNATLSCDRQGRIENLRRIDVLRQNLSTYVKSQREEASESYLQINQTVREINEQQYSIFQQFNKTGSIKSVNLDQVPIRIGLADIYDFAETREFDTSRAGALRMHLECNFNKLEPFAAMPDNSILDAFKEFVDITTEAEVPNTIVVGSTANGATKFQSLDQSPYYVGQRLEILATPAGTAPPAALPADTYRVISAIEWVADGTLKLTFVSAWAAALGVNAEWSGINVKIVPYDTAVFNINRAEVVMKRVMQPTGIDQIAYTTYSTEETLGNGATSFRNIYTVEPEAENVLMLFPNESGGDGLTSAGNTISSWRLSLNNIDLTDRDIVLRSPLAYDRLSQSLRSMGYSLANLTQNPGKFNSGTTSWSVVYSDTALDLTAIANPLFQTTQTKLLQVQINATAPGLKNIILYKTLPRVFSY